MTHPLWFILAALLAASAYAVLWLLVRRGPGLRPGRFYAIVLLMLALGVAAILAFGQGATP